MKKITIKLSYTVDIEVKNEKDIPAVVEAIKQTAIDKVKQVKDMRGGANMGSWKTNPHEK